MPIENLLSALRKGATEITVGAGVTLEEWEKLLKEAAKVVVLHAHLPLFRTASFKITELLALHLKMHKNLKTVDLSGSGLLPGHIEILCEAFGFPALTDQQREDYRLPKALEVARKRRESENLFKIGVSPQQEQLRKVNAQLLILEAKHTNFRSLAQEALRESTQLRSAGDACGAKVKASAAREAARIAKETERELTSSRLEVESLKAAIQKLQQEFLPATITNLILANNNIGDPGVRAIVHVLKLGIGKSDNKLPIQNLDLRNNSLPSEAIETIADALLAGARLVSLDLRGNTIDSFVAMRLAEALKMHPDLRIDTDEPLLKVPPRVKATSAEGASPQLQESLPEPAGTPPSKPATPPALEAPPIPSTPPTPSASPSTPTSVEKPVKKSPSSDDTIFTLDWDDEEDRELRSPTTSQSDNESQNDAGSTSSMSTATTDSASSSSSSTASITAKLSAPPVVRASAPSAVAAPPSEPIAKRARSPQVAMPSLDDLLRPDFVSD